MKRLSSCVVKGAFVFTHACILYCVVSPITLWAIQSLESPTPDSTADSARDPGIPRGIPPHMQIASPGDFRVGSGAGIPVINRKAIAQGSRTEGNGRLLAEIVSPAKTRSFENIIQTVKLVDTVRSSPFTRRERTTRTTNLRGTVLTAKKSAFLENPEAGSTVPAKKVPHTQALGAPLHLQHGEPPRSTPILARLRWLAAHWLTSNPCMNIVVPSCFGCMFQRTHGGGELTSSNFNYRIPPQWGPEMEHAQPPYRFRAWCMDVRLWTMLTDLDPRQQCAAMIMRLTGHAWESARTLTRNEINNGGVLQGRRLDPVSFLMAGLAQRYAQLGDESRLAAMVEFQSFQRLQGEGINQLLDRYSIVRHRAEIEGNFVMSVEACCLQLLRCMHLSPQQFLQYLQPFGGRLPFNEDEFMELQSHMRRIGHIVENAPNNIAQSLNNP